MKSFSRLFLLRKIGLEQKPLWTWINRPLMFFVSALWAGLFFFQSGAAGEEVVFELKREKKQQTKKKKAVPLKFKRRSFSYSKNFVIFNERPKSPVKPGTALRVYIPYSLIASFSEEFPVYGAVLSPFRGIVSGKIRGIKDTGKALVSFNEIIIGEEVQAFPVFLEGDLKEALLKDLVSGFFESLPSALALALRERLPEPQIQFINADLKNKMGRLPVLEQNRRERMKYLEIKNPGLFQTIVK